MRMITRRSMLGGFAVLPFGASLLTSKSWAQTASTFDYYIGPNGSDSNPGTQASPWSIHAINSKWSVYAGKRVGLLDGTYDLTALPQTQYTVKLAIAPGSQGSPTVVQAVNPRQAILSCNRSSGSYVIGPIIGNGNQGSGIAFAPHDITIKDLTITGGSDSGVSFGGINPKDSPRLIVDGCHIYDMVQSNGNNNIGCIKSSMGVVGMLVNNCHLHNCYQSNLPTTDHGNSSGIHSYDNSMTVQYCTIHDCNNAIYQKNGGSSTTPPDGMTVRNCYIYGGSSGMGETFAGFNNATGTSPPYAPAAFYNNVIEQTSETIYYGANSGADGLQSGLSLYNNTFYSTGTLSLGYWIPTSAAQAAHVAINVYNNILVRANMSGSRGDLTLGPVAGAWRVCDYNCYPASPQFGISTGSAYPNLMSFSTWKALGGTPDIHSLQQAPAFGGSITLGAGPQQYQLAAGSPCRGAGRVGGTSSGAQVDMGAWGGATQIGHNFGAVSSSTIPDAPTLTVS